MCWWPETSSDWSAKMRFGIFLESWMLRKRNEGRRLNLDVVRHMKTWFLQLKVLDYWHCWFIDPQMTSESLKLATPRVQHDRDERMTSITSPSITFSRPSSSQYPLIPLSIISQKPLVISKTPQSKAKANAPISAVTAKSVKRNRKPSANLIESIASQRIQKHPDAETAALVSHFDTTETSLHDEEALSKRQKTMKSINQDFFKRPRSKTGVRCTIFRLWC